MKVERIEWVDSATTHGWHDEQAAPLNIVSVGIVVEDCKEYISLTEARVLNPPAGAKTLSFGCTTAIPKSAITKRKVLK